MKAHRYNFSYNLSYVQTMRIFVRLIACILVGNRMPHIESRMRYATISVDCPHDASVLPVVFHGME